VLFFPLIHSIYTLDISSLPAGIYVVRVLTANGTVATAKVVKELVKFG